jgi:hypothetical protein
MVLIYICIMSERLMVSDFSIVSVHRLYLHTIANITDKQT